MKLILQLLVAVVFSQVVFSQEEADSVLAIEPSADSLKYTSVSKSLMLMGELGLPLGTITTIQCRIYDGDETQMWMYQNVYLLEILKVNGKRVKKGLIIRHEDLSGQVPNGDFELFKLLYGKETGSIDMEQGAKMKKEYAGKKFNLVVYETGAFVGMPDGYFDYMPIRQGTGFYFDNYLIVLKNEN
jgi:hypothetical protein